MPTININGTTLGQGPQPQRPRRRHDQRRAACRVDAFFSLVCPGLWSVIDDERKHRYRANADIGFAGPPVTGARCRTG